MIQDYLTSNLNKATYELIDGGKRFYAEIKSLRGVWAIGKTVEECRNNLLTAIESWLVFRLKKNLPIPNFKMRGKQLIVGKYA